MTLEFSRCLDLADWRFPLDENPRFWSFLSAIGSLAMTPLGVFIAAVLVGCAAAQSDLTGSEIVYVFLSAPYDLHQDMFVTWFVLTLQTTCLWRHSMRFSRPTSHCSTSAPTPPQEVRRTSRFFVLLALSLIQSCISFLRTAVFAIRPRVLSSSISHVLLTFA